MLLRIFFSQSVRGFFPIDQESQCLLLDFQLQVLSKAIFSPSHPFTCPPTPLYLRIPLLHSSGCKCFSSTLPFFCCRFPEIDAFRSSSQLTVGCSLPPFQCSCGGSSDSLNTDSLSISVSNPLHRSHTCSSPFSMASHFSANSIQSLDIHSHFISCSLS